MDCIILQNTYCACMDLSSQLRSLIPDANIPCMTEEALELVKWLGGKEGHADCIIADAEACDGDTIDIFRRSAVKLPLILTCNSPDDTLRCCGLNVIGILLKPVNSTGLKKALSQINNQILL